MEPVYRALEIAAKALVAATGTRITYQGLEHIPRTGGAVIAINHTSYVDWVPAALAAACPRADAPLHDQSRDAAGEGGQLPDQAHQAPFRSTATPGREAYAEAVRRLRDGEIVGVMPEATISRSFELKEFKTGAARMALEAEVPIIPLIVWGAQRIWTKDHPRDVGRRKIPVTVAAGPPLSPIG